MLKKKEFPILEFDENETAMINPSHVLMKHGMLGYDKLVISFFKEAIDKLLTEKVIEHYRTISGENDLLIYRFIDDDVLLVHGSLGCPACGGHLDELTGMGINKVMFCGGGGVLDKTIDVGKLMIVEGAIRDEGFSYHYVRPSRIIYTDEEVSTKISDYLSLHNISYFKGLTWTTDAFFRETKDKVNLRKEEGAKIVEMEQSGCIAVAKFRNIKYGAIIYAGDDVSQEQWDNRQWKSRKGLRYDLILICKDILKII